MPITELSDGMWIKAKIDTSIPEGKAYLQELGIEDESFALPAKLIKIIRHPDGAHTLIAQTREDVFIRIDEDENVKVKLFEGEGFFYKGVSSSVVSKLEETPIQPINQPIAPTRPKRSSNTSIILIVVLVMLLVLIILIISSL